MKVTGFSITKILMIVCIVIYCLSSGGTGNNVAAGTSSGYWQFLEIKSQKYICTLPANEIVVNQFNVVEGSMSGTLTTDGHGGEGPATWGGECSWTWKATNGLDKLLPGEIIEGTMTVTDRSIPEKVSGWNHGYTGVSGNIRLDAPYMGMGTVHSAAVDLLNISAGWTLSATQDGKLTVPEGPGHSEWQSKMSLAVSCSFGRYERVYECVPKSGSVPSKTPPKPPVSSGRKPSCPEGGFFYGPEITSKYFTRESSLNWSQEQMTNELANALTKYSDAGNAVVDGVQPFDNASIASSFYSGASPTTLEDKLRERVKQFYSNGNQPRLSPGDLFRLSLEVSKGNVRNALLTCHAVTYRNGKDEKNTNKAFVEKYCAPIRKADGYADTEIKYAYGLGGIDSKTFNPRKNVANDEQGVWYHYFGMAALSFTDDTGMVPFGLIEAGVLIMKPDEAKELRTMWSFDGSIVSAEPVSERKGFPRSESVKSTLSNYAIALENIVRSRGGSIPDPDKQCVNYWGAAAGEALAKKLALLVNRKSYTRDKVMSETMPLGPAADPYRDGYEEIVKGNFGKANFTTLSMHSPATLRIEGERGEFFLIDQKKHRFDSNTLGVFVTPFVEKNDTLGGVITPFFKIKSIKIDAENNADIMLGVYQHGSKNVHVQIFSSRKGDTCIIDPASFSKNTSDKGNLGIEIIPAGGHTVPPTDFASLGTIWKVNEIGQYTGTWTRRKGKNIFDAEWNNGTVRDIIDIVSVKGNQVVLYRHDNNGRYFGTISPDGKSIKGTASWYEKDWTWTAKIMDGKIEPTTNSSDWSGTWSTNFKKMVLTQKGVQVTGAYEHKNGRIEGTVLGNLLQGTWTQSNGSGRFEFQLSNDGRSFEGKWGDGNTLTGGAWNGTRLSP